MLKFIREVISIYVKIKRLVGRKENILNAIENVEEEDPTVVIDDKCHDKSHDIDNVVKETPTVGVNDKCHDKSHDIDNVEKEDPTVAVVDNKCHDKSHDIDNEQEPEFFIVYEKVREYPRKRSFHTTFPEEDVREEFEMIVKKIKIKCATKAAKVLLKHNVGQSIICEALGIDGSVLKSLEEAKEELERNSNEEPAITDVESKQNVLREKNEDRKDDKNIKNIKDCYVQLENIEGVKVKKKYKRIILCSDDESEIKSPKLVRF